MKHRILRKIRATFLSLSKEKKATSAGVKRLRRSRRPLAYSLKASLCIQIMIIRDQAKGQTETEFLLVLWKSFCPSFMLAYIIHNPYNCNSTSAQNREKFDPVRRLFLPSLPLA